ncbi:MAG TPA: PucR family transcriptional regulator [Candidatus Blautia intestinavium]|nr:PucR family transcriptional regulator [Candidatus Blautia intestinavium]HJC56246.1 PucR family transcriptional regulator [Candidatus Eisenbergiella intestinipullorum]
MAIRFWELFEETRGRYQLRLLAGKQGMDSVVSWVHMVEDETIISRFGGTELAVTTGMKAGVPGWLLRLVSSMKKAGCAGIIVNTGRYLAAVPQEVVVWCGQHDFPLLEMPWEISVTQLIQDYCMRIMQQSHREAENNALFIRLLLGKEVSEDFFEEMGSRFHLDGTFRIFCMKPVLTAEEKVLFRQAALRLENVFGLWKSGSKIRFPYFLLELNETWILSVNDLPESDVCELTSQIGQLFADFFADGRLHLGVGPACQGVRSLKLALSRARTALKMACHMEQKIVYFDQMGFFGILFSTSDPELLKNYADRLLAPLDAYDSRHAAPSKRGTGYADTLRAYIENDRSLARTAAATFTHRNTVSYRIQNMKQLLGSGLSTPAELFPYQIAFWIRDMKL